MEDIKLAKRIHDNGCVIPADDPELDGEDIIVESAKDYDDKAYNIDRALAYRDVAWGLIKCYAPAIVLGSISIASLLTGYGILKKRELAAIATTAAIRQAFDGYRARVSSELGSDAEKHFYYGTQQREHDEVITDEKGKSKTHKVRYELATTGSMYSRIYDEAASDWKKSGMMNFDAIVSDLRYLNFKLIANGHLFLNDVYKQLGFPISCQGQMAGWIYDPENPEGSLLKFVGMEDVMLAPEGGIIIDYTSLSDSWKALKNDYERSILIDFVNLHDNILEDLPRVDNRIAVV